MPYIYIIIGVTLKQVYFTIIDQLKTHLFWYITNCNQITFFHVEREIILCSHENRFHKNHPNLGDGISIYFRL